MNILEKLQSFDFKNNTPDDVRNLLSNLKIYSIPFYINKGVYIIRGRKGAGFTKRSQMTYCPEGKCSTLKRASLVNQTMFYGVISNKQSNQQDALLVALCECSILCREGVKSKGKENFSLSYWEILKPLHVVSFINDMTFHKEKGNELLNQLRRAYVTFHGESNSSGDDKDISKFISSEFSKEVKDSTEYLISATIATDIIKDMGYDGIVYPSVQLHGKWGINIALTPQAVNKKLRFKRIVEHTLYKNKGHSILLPKKIVGKKQPLIQIPDVYIERRLGIRSLSELPNIE